MKYSPKDVKNQFGHVEYKFSTLARVQSHLFFNLEMRWNAT